MNREEVKELINQIDQSSIQEFSYQTQTDSLYISKIKDRKSSADQAVSVQSDKANHQLENTQQAVTATEPAAVPAVQNEDKATEPTQAATGKTINSPLVGVVYLAKNPDQPPYKTAGDQVEAGETVCIVEAMKVMNEIPADISGVITNVLVEDGQIVEFGQPLFEVN